jgi:hypothetical protein
MGGGLGVGGSADRSLLGCQQVCRQETNAFADSHIIVN